MAEAPRFQPHFNRALGDQRNPQGKYFGSSKEYYGELKKRGLEPYDPSAKDTSKRKDYKPSEELRRTVQAIKQQTHNGKFKPSENLVRQMQKMGVKTHITEKDLKNLPKDYKKGGYA